MAAARKVAVLVGSLRRDSFNRKLAHAIAGLAPDHLHFGEVEIAQLPFYNQDDETEPPPATWAAFRGEIRACDALLFVTAEYNRSIPAVLKNAIDVGSRPRGHSVWTGKPGAIASSSIGAIGGFAANHHLRQSTGAIGMRILPTPEIYIGGVQSVFNEKGELTSDATRDMLKSFLQAFANWIEAVRAL